MARGRGQGGQGRGGQGACGGVRKPKRDGSGRGQGNSRTVRQPKK